MIQELDGEVEKIKYSFKIIILNLLNKVFMLYCVGSGIKILGWDNECCWIFLYK